MIQDMSTNEQLERLSRRSLRFIRLALFGLLFAASPSYGQEGQENQEDDVLRDVFMGGELPLADLSGKRIDADWFRYTNLRFGLAIDIPARGYRYVLPANGSGMAVISGDESIWITIYTHFVVNHPIFFLNADDPDILNAAAAISRIYDYDTAETVASGSTITYSVKKKHFYVLSGHFQGKIDQDTTFTYYDRYLISPRCPHVFNSLRITYPKSKERELDKFVTRLSRSLRATCQGDGEPGAWH
jgi:hypothetical protein